MVALARSAFSSSSSRLSLLFSHSDPSPLSVLRSPLSALRSPFSALRSPLSALRSPQRVDGRTRPPGKRQGWEAREGSSSFVNVCNRMTRWQSRDAPSTSTSRLGTGQNGGADGGDLAPPRGTLHARKAAPRRYVSKAVRRASCVVRLVVRVLGQLTHPHKKRPKPIALPQGGCPTHNARSSSRITGIIARPPGKRECWLTLDVSHVSPAPRPPVGPHPRWSHHGRIIDPPKTDSPLLFPCRSGMLRVGPFGAALLFGRIVHVRPGLALLGTSAVLAVVSGAGYLRAAWPYLVPKSP